VFAIYAHLGSYRGAADELNRRQVPTAQGATGTRAPSAGWFSANKAITTRDQTCSLISDARSGNDLMPGVGCRRA